MIENSKEIQPRITQEDIIIDNMQTANTLQSVICPVCLTLLSLPHSVCQSCDNAFCDTCLQNWLNKQPQTCIFKCSNPKFKVVKRSNTYQAIMDLLRTRCKECQQQVTVSWLAGHLKECPKKKVRCQMEGCLQVLMREEIVEHMQNCDFRKLECVDCHSAIQAGILEAHRKECPQRPILCPNKGCQIPFPARTFQVHEGECQFRQLECHWCKCLFLKKNFQIHNLKCELRQFICNWCSQKYLSSNNFKEHQAICSERRVECVLCTKLVRWGEEKDHRLQCIFEELVDLKASHRRLQEENLKLKLKVNDLQMELEQSNQNRHEMTVESLIKIKDEEKKEYEKDLLRIKNSITSIRKCRNQELSEHLKKLHLSTSFCGFCSSIRNKLEEELEPLLRIQEETLTKIRQLERVQVATKRSVIRIGR